MSESDCRRIAAHLCGYVDEALPDPDRAEVERHLRECSPCRALAAAEQSGRAVLRGCAGRLRADALPPGLRSRCESIGRECARPAAGWLGRLLPVGLAAGLIAATGGTIAVLATERSDAVLATQLAADHLKCFRFFAPGDGAAEVDAGTVEQMLQTRYGWNVHVPPSSEADGIRLTGARRCFFAEGRIPHVMYQSHGRNVSLFILEGVSRRPADVTALGQQAHIWSHGTHTFVLVSSASTREAADVARYVEQDAH